VPTSANDLQAFTTQRDVFEAELKKAQAILLDRQELVDKLEAEVLAVRKELSAVQTLSANAYAKLSTAQQRLQVATETFAEKDRQITEAIERQRIMTETLNGRSYDDIEVNELRSALLTESENRESMERRAEEADASRKHMEMLEFGARQELDIAREEAVRRKSEIAQLETKAAQVESEGQLESVEKQAVIRLVFDVHSRLIHRSSLQERMDEARVDADTLRIKLEDAQTALVTAGYFADSLQNQYEDVSAVKLKLEDELAKVHETLADRSTDSEARQRDEQLFLLQEDLQAMKRALIEKRQDYEKELAASKFEKEKDAEDRRNRIIQLESRIGKLQADLELAQKARHTGGSENVGLLHVKMQQLRGERDELRRNLSFNEHEHHFAFKAAEADRASALEDLGIIRADLEQKTAALCASQEETAQLRERLQAVSARLESVFASFATASTEKNDLADRVAHFELELGHTVAERDELLGQVATASEQESASLEAHREHHEQLVDLASRLAMEQSERSKAQNELLMSNRARSDLETRVDQLQSKAASELQDAKHDERPPSPIGHVRRRSGLPSPTIIQNLQAEIADLQSRIQRRDREFSCSLEQWTDRELQTLSASFKPN